MNSTFNLDMLRVASELGQSNKHRMMARAADRIEELQARIVELETDARARDLAPGQG